MRLISIGHRRGQGKDTLAKIVHDILVDEGRSVFVTSIAEPVKVAARSLYGITHTQCWGTSQDRSSLTGVHLSEIGIEECGYADARQVLCYVGKGMRDAFGVEVLLDSAIRRGEASGAEFVVVSDVRLLHEAEFFSNAGVCIKVCGRPVPDLSTEEELALDDWNGWSAVIENTGGLDDLYFAAGDVLDSIIPDR